MAPARPRALCYAVTGIGVCAPPSTDRILIQNPATKITSRTNVMTQRTSRNVRSTGTSGAPYRVMGAMNKVQFLIPDDLADLRKLI